MRIKIIGSKPTYGQDGIDNIIGQEFDVIYEVGDGRVAIDSEKWCGTPGIPIIVNPDEYEEI